MFYQINQMSRNLYFSICFDNTLTKNSIKYGFGDHVEIFIRWLINTDEEDLEKTSSIFSLLENFNYWSRWTISYCRLVNFLSESEYKIKGVFSDKQFDDYKLYRRVTILNSVGQKHGEDEEEAEYREMLKLTKKYEDENPLAYYLSFYFYSFVLNTLSVIKINRKVVIQFSIFVKQFLSKDQSGIFENIMYYRFVFSKIKLSKTKYRITFLEDNTANGKILKTFYIQIENFHWYPLLGQKILSLLSNVFPDTNKQIEIIQSIAECTCIDLNENVVNTKYKDNIVLKRWTNRIPFLNGIFDLSRKDSNNIIVERYKKSINSHPLPVINTPIIHFRNYNISDVVVDPIEHVFDIKDYQKTFFNTHLLSLDNQERYGMEFCLFYRSIFGEDIHTGKMGPYNYMNMLCFEINMAIGALRNNQNQNCSILYGPKANNGKSALLEKKQMLFGPQKFAKISAGLFFKEGSTNEQSINLHESMYIFDDESKYVDINEFKKKICGGDIMERGIYKSLNRANPQFILGHFIFATNNGIKNAVNDINSIDYGFLRRCCQYLFLNRFGKHGNKQDIKKNPKHANFGNLYNNCFNGIKLFEQKDFCDTEEEEQQQQQQQQKGDYEVGEECDEDDEDDDEQNEQENWDVSKSILNIELNKKHKRGVSLKEPQVVESILKGMLYYFLDVIFVFNLGAINISSDIMICPLYNQRIIGSQVSEFLNKIKQEYIFYDEYKICPKLKKSCKINIQEFVTKLNVPENFIFQQSTSSHNNNSFVEYSVDLMDIKKSLTNIKNISIEAQRDILEHFEINLIKSVVDPLDVTSILGLKTMESSNEKANVDETKYKIEIVDLSRKFSNDQNKFITENPHKNFYYKDELTKRENFTSDKNFVLASIPPAHQFEISSDLDKKYFQVVANLLTSTKVEPSAYVGIDPNYENMKLDDFLKRLY